MNLRTQRRALFTLILFVLCAAAARAQVTVIKAGRFVDPEAGTAAANQTIVVEGRRIKALGSNVPVPAGATVIDLSAYTVLPGLSADITALRRVAFVMKDGKVIRRP